MKLFSVISYWSGTLFATFILIQEKKGENGSSLPPPSLLRPIPHHPPLPTLLSVDLSKPIPLSMAPPYQPRSTAIERKRYSIEIDPRYRGSRIKLTETTKDRAFFISRHWSSLTWITSVFSTLLDAPINHKFYREHRIDDQTLWVEKTSNKRGTIVEITKLDNNGGLDKIIVPIGTDRKGWRSFYTLLSTGQNIQKPPPTVIALKRKGTINYYSSYPTYHLL